MMSVINFLWKLQTMSVINTNKTNCFVLHIIHIYSKLLPDVVARIAQQKQIQYNT